jgi:hypothetical protein
MTADGTEIERACAHLLGTNFCARPGWQSCLDPALLKRAFRKKVFAVHPDRATSLGIPAAILQERFVKLQRSYDQLVQYLSRPTSATTASAPVRATRPRKNAQKPPTASSYYVGQRPSRPLKLGEFLYYGGSISQEQLFGAVRWQARQRPRIGEIAMSFGYLDSAGISHLLELRQSLRILHEPLAQFARNQGYLTHFQWLAVVGRQRRLQKPIGQYWIETGLYSAQEIAELVSAQRKHNWYFART